MNASLTSQYWCGAKQIFGISDFQNASHCYKIKNYRDMTINGAKGTAKIAMFTLVSLGTIYGITKIFSVDKLDEFNRLYEDQKFDQAKAIISECLENTSFECKRVNEQSLSLLDKFDLSFMLSHAKRCLESHSPNCKIINEKAAHYIMKKLESPQTDRIIKDLLSPAILEYTNQNNLLKDVK